MATAVYPPATGSSSSTTDAVRSEFGNGEDDENDLFGPESGDELDEDSDDGLLLESLVEEAEEAADGHREGGKDANEQKTQEQVLRELEGGTTTKSTTLPAGVEIEPYSQIRLQNRAVLSEDIEASMKGKSFVLLKDLTGAKLRELQANKTNYVTIGVLVGKRSKATSSTGSDFTTWTVSDMRYPKSASISVFLFGAAASNKTLAKVSRGKVVLLYKPKALKAREGSDMDAVSISQPDSIVVIGASKDFGFCRGSTGPVRCQAVVNTRTCPYCEVHFNGTLSHIQSQRMGLNSSAHLNAKVPAKAFGSNTHLSQGTFSVPTGRSQLSGLGATPSTQRGKGKKGDSTAVKMFPLAQQLHQHKNQKADPNTRVTAVINKDGMQLISGKVASKKLKPGELSDRSTSFVQSINHGVARSSTSIVSKMLSRGAQRFYSACTGTDFDSVKRHEERLRQKDIRSGLESSKATPRKAVTSLDPLARSLQAKTSQREKAKFLTAGQHMGHRVPNAADERAERAIQDKKLLRVAEKQLAPAMARVNRESNASHNTITLKGQPAPKSKGVMSINKDIALRHQRELLETQRRANAEAKYKAVLKQRALQEAQEKILKVKERLDASLRNKKKATLARKNDPLSKFQTTSTIPAQGGWKSEVSASTAKETKRTNVAQLFNQAKSTPSLQQMSKAKRAPLVIAPPSKRLRLTAGNDVKLQEMKSIHSKLADDKKQNQMEANLRVLAEAEHVATQLSQVQSVKTKCWMCHECDTKLETPLERCKLQDHEMSCFQVTKYFFRCLNDKCNEKTTTLGKKVCHKSCQGCGGIRWEPCSAYSDKRVGIAPKARPASQFEGMSTTFNRRGG